MADQTPRVPELWWSPGRICVSLHGYTYLPEPPADAVRLVPEAEQLADVKGLSSQLDEANRAGLAVVRQLDEIREALAGWRHDTHPLRNHTLVCEVIRILGTDAA